ncbi:MAG: ATP phosphoribosyltransferase regulatory subunit [Thiotrichales bacterium]
MTLMERWLLPEGVEEALPVEANWLEHIRRELIDMYRSWGYELVFPPFIEFLESLLPASGPDLDLQTFKVTDQLTGRMMGVRADITPQVARIDAHRLNRSGPTRLCYLGTVLKTRPDDLGGSRSPLQVGAEVYGHAGAASDLEIISLLIETLKVCGIDPIHLDLGHSGIFRQIVRELGLGQEDSERLFGMLQRKAVPEITALAEELDLDKTQRKLLPELALLSGDPEILSRARELFSFSDSLMNYVDALRQLARMISARYPDVHVHCDLAEMRGYHYERGIVFSAYTPGEGSEIARGGRYDGLGREFGRERAAVGFSTDLKTLRQLSQISIHDTSRRVWVPDLDDEELLAFVHKCREQGDIVIQSLDGDYEQSKELGCTHYIVNREGQWTVEEMG